MKGKTLVKVLANLIFNKIRILDIFRSFWKLQWERRSAMSLRTPVFHSLTSHSGASRCGCFGCGLTHRLSRDFAWSRNSACGASKGADVLFGSGYKESLPNYHHDLIDRKNCSNMVKPCGISLHLLWLVLVFLQRDWLQKTCCSFTTTWFGSCTGSGWFSSTCDPVWVGSIVETAVSLGGSTTILLTGVGTTLVTGAGRLSVTIHTHILFFLRCAAIHKNNYKLKGSFPPIENKSNNIPNCILMIARFFSIQDLRQKRFPSPGLRPHCIGAPRQTPWTRVR